MDWDQILTISVIQGLTEFLPVSSSAHLALIPALTGWQDQGMAFDVAVHFGTLAAVLTYYRVQLWGLITASFGFLKTRTMTADTWSVFYLMIATLPACVLGLWLAPLVSHLLRDPKVLATTSVIFGIVLGLSYLKGTQQKSWGQIGFKEAACIGLCQAVSLIPGVSRSGITLSAGLGLGLSIEAAARFSFLLSIPTILGAGLLTSIKIAQSATPVAWGPMGAAVVCTSVVAYACIANFVPLLSKIGVWPFVGYRVLLGVALWWWLF